MCLNLSVKRVHSLALILASELGFIFGLEVSEGLEGSEGGLPVAARGRVRYNGTDLKFLSQRSEVAKSHLVPLRSFLISSQVKVAATAGCDIDPELMKMVWIRVVRRH